MDEAVLDDSPSRKVGSFASNRFNVLQSLNHSPHSTIAMGYFSHWLPMVHINWLMVNSSNDRRVWASDFKNPLGHGCLALSEKHQIRQQNGRTLGCWLGEVLLLLVGLMLIYGASFQNASVSTSLARWPIARIYCLATSGVNSLVISSQKKRWLHCQEPINGGEFLSVILVTGELDFSCGCPTFEIYPSIQCRQLRLIVQCGNPRMLAEQVLLVDVFLRAGVGTVNHNEPPLTISHI